MTSQTPAKLGYRMPAEWHRHSATWLAWPTDPLTWPDRVPQVEEIFLQMMAALTPYETVNLLVDDEATEQAVRRRSSFAAVENIRFQRIPTADSWIRDYGPNFLSDDKGGLAYNDWIFNAWGNKYEELKKDNSIPSRLESILNVPRFEPGIVMEGGSIEVNGAGVVVTTEQCLLNPNRNPHLDRAQIEQYLRTYLGVEKVLWLGEGIVGDDTDGHVDDIARFVSPGTIVCALEEDPADPNYKPLHDNFKRLQHATDTRGKPFELITLPMPGIVGSRKSRLPASYANFYIANGVVLVPVFGHTNDPRALQTIQRLFPDRRVLGINCEPIVWGMGAIHCVTQQQPEPQIHGLRR
jgi:agmatine deiminase